MNYVMMRPELRYYSAFGILTGYRLEDQEVGV
jgi:hypothetical protein